MSHQNKTTVRLGLMVPLTGVVGIYGNEITRAAQIACDEVNEAGGVLGLPLEIVIEDDGSLPDSSIVAANKLVKEHNCVALVGNLLSNSRIAVAYKVAEPSKVPYLNFSFYEGSILSKYFFHFAALPNQQIDRMIPYMKNKFGPNFFFAGNNYEWPRGSIDAAKKILQSVGGVTIGEEYFPMNPSDDELNRMLDQVKGSGANVFVPYFAGADQINVLKLLDKKGMRGKIAIVMGHFDEIMCSMLPSEMREGFYTSNTYFMSINTPQNRDFLGKLKKLPEVTDLWPNGNGIITNFGEGTYICIKAFAFAANQAGSLEIDKLLHQLEEVSITAPQGLVKMNSEIHHASVNTFLARSKNDGTFDVIESFESVLPVIPIRYRHLSINSHASLEDEVRLQARILSQMSEGVSLVRASDGQIIYTTSGFDKMFGSQEGAYVGKHISAIYTPGNSPSDKIVSVMNDFLYKIGNWKGEIQARKMNGTLFWCEVDIYAFTHAEHGEVLMSVFRDITERKERDELLQRATLEAEASNKHKTEFLIYMSHELKTPLTSIIGYSQFLLRSVLKNGHEQYVQNLKKIENSSHHILDLIKDVLDVSRIETGNVIVNVTSFNLMQVMNEVLDGIKPIADRNNNKVVCHIAENLAEMKSDVTKLKQILLNLLSNACKFTDDGIITVNIFECPFSKERSISFEVIDAGIGISKAEAQKMFIPFTQIIIDRNIPSSGLGLVITKGHVEILGGEIKFESEVGKGSKFTVTLPSEIN